MKKILRRIAVLLVIFVLGVAGTAFWLNSETTDDRTDMGHSTMPELMVDMGGTLANRMCGYAQPMQADFIRDSITPLDTSKRLTFVINPYDTKVKSLSYEIRTSDGSKVIENKKLKNLKEKDKYLRAVAEIGKDLRMSQEYSMQITLDTNKGMAYYYTRVISRSQLNTEHYVSFVKNFYEKCMDKITADDLAAYLEPDSSGNATNFSNIGIHSTIGEVSWGEMKPQIYRKGIPVVKDINETTASVAIEYQISAKDEEGNLRIYDVDEFYRMRFTEARIRLLNFEREANQVFDPELPVVSAEGLNLGIRNKNVNYMINEEGTAIAFVQQGDLWSYSPQNGKISKIFSFRREENGDLRDIRREHDIKIIRVGANGDVDFVLFGYMNRGIHEGHCGVCVYHYSNDQNVVEEKVFIPTTESYEFLKEDLGTLSYVNEENQLFLLFARNLYQVDIEEQTYSVLEKGINSENFVVSETNGRAAWQLKGKDYEGRIKEIDFNTKQTRVLAPEKGQVLRTVGFMNEDMIYGLLSEADILTDTNGHVKEGIHTLKIEDFDGTVKKEYHRDGLYITDITVGSTLTEFELSAKSGKNVYVPQTKDNIMNNRKAAANRVNVELVAVSGRGIVVRLGLEKKPVTKEPLISRAKMRNTQRQEVSLDTQVPKENVYYVYAHGGLDGIYYDPAEAVRRADSEGGVVLNRAQQYVWERGNLKTKFQMNIDDVPKIMRKAVTDKKKLQEALGDKGTVMDLSGCTLDSVLYQISAQRPVVAKTGKKSSVLIVGYDEYNTWLYDAKKKEIYPYGLNDSRELFEKAGNIFISYMENVNY